MNEKMTTQLNMFKFSRNEQLWQKLETCFDKAYPRENIKMICRLQDKHKLAGFSKLATPIYNFPGCVEDQYSSFIISKQPELAQNPILAVNELDSYSGKLAMDKWLQRKNIPYQELKVTGAHIESVRFVLESKAHIAAIDCVSWAYIQAEIPEAKNLHIIDQTELVAGHPIVIQNKPNDLSKEIKVESDLLEKLGIKSFKFH
ncbi:MAG: hypothetical protein CME62_04250 [Halobacteriovoraceae bacterium]|nr:hypothetical protein [Halobacteriovoraceae bacterium]